MSESMPEIPPKAVVKRADFVMSKGLAPRPGTVPHESNLNRNDILFALFKHKRKIIACGLAGLVAATGVYFLYPPVYESQAKLLVRYLVERSSVDAIDNSGSAGGVTRTAENVLGSEVEILTSWDLAVQVADAIGPKRHRLRRLLQERLPPDSRLVSKKEVTSFLFPTRTAIKSWPRSC
jgi:uncharacterized protein involved in exopolysaccharide biosynthesis